MKVLIIGSGAREHALTQALARSPQKPRLYCYGNSQNPGIQQFTTAYRIGSLENLQLIQDFAANEKFDLAVIGPEKPLELGIADLLWSLGVPTIGPKKALAQIETSKEYARELMQKYHISGLPRYKKFSRWDEETENSLDELGEGNYVIKANGLMGGKGVKIAGEHLFNHADCYQFCQEILQQQQSFLIEEKLLGPEFSFMCFADGKKLIPMPLVQDHKRAFIGNKGPNTGGMGSYSDSNHRLPFLSVAEYENAFKINEAIFAAINQECSEPYIGILYGSFMRTSQGIYVIEYNARFGDPEVLNVLTLLETDLLRIFQSMIRGNLSAAEVKFRPEATVCKYAVPIGYPESPLIDHAIDYNSIQNKESLYFASVNMKDGHIFTSSSRTLAYVGCGHSISVAERLAEAEISRLKGPLFHRPDIGTHELIDASRCLQEDYV